MPGHLPKIKFKKQQATPSERDVIGESVLPFSLRASTAQAFKFGTELLVRPSRKKLGHFLHHRRVQAILGALIIANLVIVVHQTNMKAADEAVPSWIGPVDNVILLIFFFELLARLYVARLKFFEEAFNILDFSVIGIDVILQASELTGMDGHLKAFSFLRILRLLRLTRAHRLMLMLPKLSGMVRDLVGALEAIIWGCALLFIVMTMWSILTVQLVHPLVVELTEDGVFGDCNRCGRAFSSVLNANLTYFQQIIAGDSWGRITIPIIEHHPWTALIFIPAFLTLSLAIMNVILAVIVESAEETRKDDLVERMKIRERNFLNRSLLLLRVCEALDEDDSGDLTFEEVLKGFTEHQELGMTLRDLGIDEEDLRVIYNIMDADSSGTVDFKEFVHHIHKIRTADEHTALNLIRHYVMQIFHRVKEDLTNDLEAPRPQAMAEDLHLEQNGQGAFGDFISMTSKADITAAMHECSKLATPQADGVDLSKLHDVCRQAILQANRDVLLALEDITRKCEVQTALMSDISKSQSWIANGGHAPIRVAPIPSTPKTHDLLAVPGSFSERAPTYACVLGNCTIEKRPRQLQEQRLQPEMHLPAHPG